MKAPTRSPILDPAWAGIGLLVVLAVALVGTGLWETRQMREHLRDQALRETKSSAIMTAALLSAELDTAGATMSNLGGRSALLETVDSIANLPEDGAVQIFDASGQEIVRQGPGTSELAHAGHPGVRPALNGRTGVGEFFDPDLQERRVMAFAPIPSTGGAVVFERSLGEIYEPAGGLLQQQIAMAILTGLGALFVAALVGRLLRSLHRTQQHHVAVFSSIPGGAFTTDSEGRITAINPALEELAGWSFAETRGRHYAAVYRLTSRGREVPLEDRFIHQAMHHGRPYTSKGFDTELLTKDGRALPVSIVTAPIGDRRGRTTGAVEIIREVSYEREVDQLKSSLISTASHELRTPLTMIKGFSELLLDRKLDEESRREGLLEINSAAERLGRLIDNLLSVSRIESGGLEAQAVEMDLRAAILETVRAFGASGRQIEVKVADSFPPVLSIFAEPDKVTQILTNLISNAIKYSPPHTTVTIAVRATRGSAIVSVKDEGIGLSASDKERLFQKFFRAERDEVKEVGGTGLGLFIVKNLVEMQGGRMWVDSEVDRGSTFHFTLPLIPRRMDVREGGRVEEAVGSR